MTFKTFALRASLVLASVALMSHPGAESYAGSESNVRLQLTTGGVTGTYYMIGAPLSKYIGDNSNLKLTPSTSGGGYENIRRVDSGQSQFGMTQPDTMFQAWNGGKPFTSPLRNWRTVGVVTPPMANHVVARADDGIKTASDLVGKIFAIGAPGSGASVSMMRFLTESGLEEKVTIRMLPHQDYPDMLRDKKVDVISRLGSVPSAVVNELGAQIPIVLVDFSAELKASNFFEKFPYYQPIVVKSGTYKGIDQDVTLFGNAGYIIVNKDVPDDVVYKFTKLAYSSGSIRAVGMAFKGANLKAENPLSGNIGPVHPGAIKYWKERGIKVPEPLLK